MGGGGGGGNCRSVSLYASLSVCLFLSAFLFLVVEEVIGFMFPVFHILYVLGLHATESEIRFQYYSKIHLILL